MALTFRQKKTYLHRTNIWRASRDVAAGEVTDDDWELRHEDVPCHYQYTRNESDSDGVGRFKRRSMDTEDLNHMSQDEDLRDQDILEDVTPQGVLGANRGQTHRVQGISRVIPGSHFRRLRKLTVPLMQEEQPPAVIAEHVAQL